MFSLLSGVVLRRPWVMVMTFVACGHGAVPIVGPRMGNGHHQDQRSRFFFRSWLGVMGQRCSRRGPSRMDANSQLVLGHERKDHAVTRSDRRHLEEVASNLYQFGLANPDFGIDKRPDSPGTPLMGPRLIGRNAEGIEQAAARDQCEFRGTYVSKKTRSRGSIAF